MNKLNIFNFSIKKNKPKQKKYTKQELSDILVSTQQELSKKKDELIDLYKERGDSFTSQIRCLEVVEEQKEEISKLKETIKDLKTQWKEYQNNVTEYAENILKLAPDVSKCDNKQDLFSYLEIYSILNDGIQIQELATVCEKLSVTKTAIKNYSESLYESLKVKSWEIED